MSNKYIQIHTTDNVVVAITDLTAGETILIDEKEIIVAEDVPTGHKIALKDLHAGDFIIKYGYPIGHAREAIKTGALVNETNIKTNLDGLQEYTYSPQPAHVLPAKENLTFKGYRRKNGDVGIRNEVWILPTVGCVNGIINRFV